MLFWGRYVSIEANAGVTTMKEQTEVDTAGIDNSFEMCCEIVGGFIIREGFVDIVILTMKGITTYL